MPSTTLVTFTASARAIGARTNDAAAAVSDLSAEEDRLVNGLLSEGALSDDAFLVKADSPASMNVKVGSGSAKSDKFAVAGDVAGQETYLVRLDDATVTVAIGASDPSQARTDEVWLIVEDSPYDSGTRSLPRIGYRKGDVGGGAPGPDTGWKAAAKLATVTVPAGATTIVASNIADARDYSVLAPAIPAGTIAQTARSSAPAGWLLCDGAAVSRATYRRLFAAIGTNFGVGDGSTTFNLPDLRGRVPVGRDAAQAEFDTLAETGGTKTETLTEAKLGAHNHNYDKSNTNRSVAAGGDFSVMDVSTTPTATSTAGTGTPINNLQPYLVVNHIIRT